MTRQYKHSYDERTADNDRQKLTRKRRELWKACEEAADQVTRHIDYLHELGSSVTEADRHELDVLLDRQAVAYMVWLKSGSNEGKAWAVVIAGHALSRSSSLEPAKPSPLPLIAEKLDAALTKPPEELPISARDYSDVVSIELRNILARADYHDRSKS